MKFTHAKCFKASLIACSVAAITACSSDLSDIPEPTPAPPPPPPESIRGVLDNPIESASLPASVLPAASLPAASLPSIELPTVEINESPTVEGLRVLDVVLQAEQEVGTTVIDAGEPLTATATFSVDELTGAINATVTADNLEDGDVITMVHIHTGFAGANGGVLIGFDQIDDSTFELNANITDFADLNGNDLTAFLTGGWYLNLHTEENPAGHLRGQLFTGDTAVSRIELQGQQENPAIENAQGVSGIGYVTVTPELESIVANVSVTGFIPFLDAPIGPVHLHTAFAGQNGPVFLPLNPVGDSDTIYSGTEANATAEIDFNLIAQGGTYINVHSAANPSGELRGQIVLGNVDVVRSELQGQQENPAVINAEGISGVGYVTINPDEQAIVANVSVEGFVPFLDAPIGPVHLHNGFAGENGPVFLPLNPVGDSETMYSATEADATDTIDFDRIARGGVYINVHSEANASGEVRGQIVPRGVDVVRSELQGQQENPAIVNAEGISGVGYVTINPALEAIVANVTVAGFVPFLDAPIGPVHLHTGFAGENGPVFLPLNPVGDSDTVYSGTEIDATDTIDFARIAQGGTYINVHSEANASGEVRGQVVPRGVEVARTELQGQQENPAIVNAEGISGVGYVTINAEQETIVANVAVEGFIPFLDAPIGPVHLHNGFAGENGGVFLPLNPVGDSETMYSGTQENAIATIDFDRIAEGGTYINVHSEANPGGEVRGQITTGTTTVIRTELDAIQQVPAVTTPASDATGGVGYFTFDASEPSFAPIVNVAVTGFQASAVQVHRGGVAGIAGPAQILLADISPSEAPGSSFTASGARSEVFNLNGLLAGAYYINALSVDNPLGEVRGQLLVDNVRAFSAELNGASALPTSDTTATGIGFITVNLSTESFIANLQVSNFDPLPSSASVNVGGDNNVVFQQLESQGEGFFSTSGQVNNLMGLLNGAYSIEATE